MKYIAYIFTTAFLRLLALLPPRLLYIFSDILFVLLFYIAGYRKKVVTKNLSASFPGKSPEELKHTRRKFYRHLADVIIENAVIQYYSKRRLEKMFTFRNPEMIREYYERGRDIILVTGHYNNWEWSAPLAYTFKHKIIVVYMPLRNKYFDREVMRARTKFGAEVVPMGNVGRILFKYKQEGIPTLTGMAADQRPIRKHVQFWTRFLNQETAVFTGSEKLARKLDAVMVFMKVKRVSRGKYSAETTLISDKPNELLPNALTEAHTHLLEQEILADPANWLWSHDRWKISYERWLKLKERDKAEGK